MALFHWHGDERVESEGHSAVLRVVAAVRRCGRRSCPTAAAHHWNDVHRVVRCRVWRVWILLWRYRCAPQHGASLCGGDAMGDRKRSDWTRTALARAGSPITNSSRGRRIARLSCDPYLLRNRIALDVIAQAQAGSYFAGGGVSRRECALTNSSEAPAQGHCQLSRPRWTITSRMDLSS